MLNTAKLRLRDFFDSVYGQIELFVEMELMENIQEQPKLRYGIIAALNILFLITLLLFTGWKQIIFVILLCAISFFNTANIFQQYKQYQLLRASTKTSPPVSSTHKYVLSTKTPGMKITTLKLPQHIETEDGRISEELIYGESTKKKVFNAILVFVQKTIVQMFHFFTFRMFVKPPPRQRLQPSRRKSRLHPELDEPQAQPARLAADERHIWELSVWNYTVVQRDFFIFFSPLNAIVIGFAAIKSLSFSNSLLCVAYCFIQTALLNTLFKLFETREQDQRLLSAEALYEESRFQRMYTAARKEAEFHILRGGSSQQAQEAEASSVPAGRQDFEEQVQQEEFQEMQEAEPQPVEPEPVRIRPVAPMTMNSRRSEIIIRKEETTQQPPAKKRGRSLSNRVNFA